MVGKNNLLVLFLPVLAAVASGCAPKPEAKHLCVKTDIQSLRDARKARRSELASHLSTECPLAVKLENNAVLLQRDGQYGEAIKLLKQAIAERERVGGANDPSLCRPWKLIKWSAEWLPGASMQVRQALYRQFVLKRANLDVRSPDVVNSFVDWATYAPSASNVSDPLVECGKLASSFDEGSPRKLLLSACAVRLNSCLQSGRASLVAGSQLEKDLVLSKPKSTIDRLMQVRCWVILGEAFFERRQFVAASNCFAQAFDGAYKERYSTDIAGKSCILINYLLSLRLCGNERELERIVAGPEAKALAGKSKEARSFLAMMRCLSVRRSPTHTEVQQIAEGLPNLHVAYLNSDYFICAANEVATELKRMHDRRIAEIFASGLADCERSGCFDDSHAVQLRRIINKLLRS